MSFDTLLNQTIGIKQRTGFDGFGQASLGSQTDVRARVEPINEIIYFEGGREKVARQRIFFPLSTSVSPGDILIYASEEWEVLSVEDVPGGNGENHHKEVRV